MKNFEDAKKILKTDREMLNCFIDLMSCYKNRFSDQKEITTANFISQNKEIAFDAFVLLEPKEFYYDKESLTEYFYKEMVYAVADELGSLHGLKKEPVLLNNKVGGDEAPFENISEAMDEYYKDDYFKEALQEVYQSYNEHFGRKANLIDDATIGKNQETVFKIANIVKETIFYKDKDALTNEFYKDMIEHSKEKVKKEFYPDEVIPYLKAEQKIEEDFDTQAYDETRKEMKEAWNSAKSFFKEGKSLASEYNPIVADKQPKEQFWNGAKSSRNFLK